jgi:hypothetical protein
MVDGEACFSGWLGRSTRNRPAIWSGDRQVFFEQRRNLPHKRVIVDFGDRFALQPPCSLAARASLPLYTPPDPLRANPRYMPL